MFFQAFFYQTQQMYTPYSMGETVKCNITINRYKGIGKTKLEDGSPDRIEFYSLAQDDILDLCPRDNPELIQTNRKTFQDFFNHAHGIIRHLLCHLDRHLALKPNTLASLNPQDKPSGTSLRLLKSLPQIVGSHQTSLPGHTDVGSITMLFNIIGGLQILPADAEDKDEHWRYVRPEPGCALINLGDAMVQWSGGILRSNVHRVATPPGEQAGCTRYSMAYLMRPEANVSMRRFVGGGVIPQPVDGEEDEDIRAEDWQRRRVAQIVLGKGVPKSIGGRKIEGQKMQKAHRSDI